MEKIYEKLRNTDSVDFCMTRRMGLPVGVRQKYKSDCRITFDSN